MDTKSTNGDEFLAGGNSAEIIGGRYRLESLIYPIGVSAVSMNRVFRALDLQSGREVVVKIAVQSPSRINSAFLIREALALDHLSNKDGIVRVLDCGCTDAGDFSLVLEYLDQSCNLYNLIQRSAPLPVDVCLEKFRQMLQIVDGVHSTGIIHQDLKPENFIISSNGKITLLDFGMARFISPNSRFSMNDIFDLREGITYGTLPLMSPEQACAHFEKICYASDLFVLAITLHEMLTGCLPFRRTQKSGGWSVAYWKQPYFCPFPSHWSFDIPEGLQEVILQALEINPEDRFPSAQAMLIALESF